EQILDGGQNLQVGRITGASTELLQSKGGGGDRLDAPVMDFVGDAFAVQLMGRLRHVFVLPALRHVTDDDDAHGSNWGLMAHRAYVDREPRPVLRATDHLGSV